MYAPDGFASLACALYGQCSFLGYQQPFVWLMKSMQQNVYAFFALQTIVWLLLIILVYLIAKELKLNHTLMTPLILLYSGVYFVDLFIGSFENDNIGIILLLIAMLFFIKYMNSETQITARKIHYLLLSLTSLASSLLFWLWAGYLIQLPTFYSLVVEEIFWAHWLQWMFLFPIIILALMQAIKKNNKTMFSILIGILLFPKLLITSVPFLLKFIDGVLDKIFLKHNRRVIITLIVCCLVLGQFIRVGMLTYNSWNREIIDSDCVTVDDEYFLRATQGLNYTYNQISTEEVNACKIQKLA